MPRQRRDIRNFKPRDRRGVSQHFNPWGQAKKSYDTHNQAVAFMEKHNLLEDYWPYRCKLCSKYHIGKRKHRIHDDT